MSGMLVNRAKRIIDPNNGYTSYIQVLDAERNLFDAELSHAETKGILFQALVNLYKAMGGGWVVEADRMTSGAADPEPTPQGSTEGWEAFRWRFYG